MSPVYAANGSLDPRSLNYESSDLNEITRRQMNEDISAYRYDLDFCRNQLAAPDLTAQETRTLQIRILDCGHNIRHCQHRIQQLDVQARSAALVPAGGYRSQQNYRAAGSAPRAGGAKRPRISKIEGEEDENGRVGGGNGEADMVIDMNGASTVSIQRLGFWKCRLCTSQKYLDSGSNRVPSAPCKWPLKDVSKMLNHFLDMHTEHAPNERCEELGAALAHNRGPFEYWLTRTRSQELDDMSVIDDLIHTLQSGTLPEALRGLNRAANAFPNTVSGIKR
ncbi:hypothetical protein GGS23DRAFT_261531 [Durotheca rogersii]|uniref:uncharacterized protein n=1 Tax=Durotheca rogersii TaxID=419775 RepID=UPI00221EF264|nr:uncharacterized protein GGS23DRAFT_261531 [Durotheca rogersii]KAI5859790.1 hypothetical protein GGS23DRAFT_261531 [Durotheca rogersii]